MKQLIAYSLLFCLVFLNVPRSVVHDCDSHTTKKHLSKQDKKKSSLSLNEDRCFVCEFDLGFFVVPEVLFFKATSPAGGICITFVESRLYAGQFNGFLHRGPPVV